jgi:hypothetical protein
MNQAKEAKIDFFVALASMPIDDNTRAPLILPFG